MSHLVRMNVRVTLDNGGIVLTHDKDPRVQAQFPRGDFWVNFGGVAHFAGGQATVWHQSLTRSQRRRWVPGGPRKVKWMDMIRRGDWADVTRESVDAAIAARFKS